MYADEVYSGERDRMIEHADLYVKSMVENRSIVIFHYYKIIYVLYQYYVCIPIILACQHHR